MRSTALRQVFGMWNPSIVCKATFAATKSFNLLFLICNAAIYKAGADYFCAVAISCPMIWLTFCFISVRHWMSRDTCVVARGV